MSCCLLFFAFYLSYFTCHVSYFYHIFIVVFFIIIITFVCYLSYFILYFIYLFFTIFIRLKTFFFGLTFRPNLDLFCRSCPSPPQELPRPQAQLPAAQACWSRCVQAMAPCAVSLRAGEHGSPAQLFFFFLPAWATFPHGPSPLACWPLPLLLVPFPRWRRSHVCEPPFSSCFALPA